MLGIITDKDIEFQFHKGAIGVFYYWVFPNCNSTFQFHKGAIGVNLIWSKSFHY